MSFAYSKVSEIAYSISNNFDFNKLSIYLTIYLSIIYLCIYSYIPHKCLYPGVIESDIVKLRNEKEIDEEMIMVSEMLSYGRLLNVGENSKVVQMTAIKLKLEDKGSANWNLIKGSNKHKNQYDIKLFFSNSKLF